MLEPEINTVSRADASRRKLNNIKTLATTPKLRGTTVTNVAIGKSEEDEGHEMQQKEMRLNGLSTHMRFMFSSVPQRLHQEIRVVGSGYSASS